MLWKNLGEQPIHHCKWFKLNLADVELPDGRHLDHYVLSPRRRPLPGGWTGLRLRLLSLTLWTRPRSHTRSGCRMTESGHHWSRL
jgi:hypothetical protein